MAVDICKVTICIDSDIKEIIKAKQFDAASRYLQVTLVKRDGAPYDLTGHKVRFNAHKRDNTHIFNDCEITDAANGVVMVELTDQTLAGEIIKPNESYKKEWLLLCDISIFTEDEQSILTTRIFTISVQPTIRNDAAIMSSNEYGAVMALFQDVSDVYSLMQSISDRIGYPYTEDEPNLTVFDWLRELKELDVIYGMLSSIELMVKILGGYGTNKRVEITSSQDFDVSANIPEYVKSYRVSAIGAGGSGGDGGDGVDYDADAAGGMKQPHCGGPGGGGGCGEFVIEQEIPNVPGEIISCVVGTGNTVFGNYITVSKGGNGGNGGDGYRDVVSGHNGHVGTTGAGGLGYGINNTGSGGDGGSGGSYRAEVFPAEKGTTASDGSPNNSGDYGGSPGAIPNRPNNSNYIDATSPGGGGGASPWKFRFQDVPISSIGRAGQGADRVSYIDIYDGIPQRGNNGKSAASNLPGSGGGGASGGQGGMWLNDLYPDGERGGTGGRGSGGMIIIEWTE